MNPLDGNLANASQVSTYKAVDFGSYSLKITSPNATSPLLDTNFYMANCGRYSVVLFTNPSTNQLDYVILTDLQPNGLSIVWQFIQIFVMSLAEILLAISSLAFAFSQAPKTMKPTCLTLRYIAVSLGDLIVLIAAEARYNLSLYLINHMFFLKNFFLAFSYK